MKTDPRHQESLSWRRAVPIGVMVIMTITGWSFASSTGELAQPAGGMILINQDVTTGPSGTFLIRLQLPGILADDDVLTLSIHEPVLNEDDFLAASRQEHLGGVLESIPYKLADLDPNPFGLIDLVIELEVPDAIEQQQVKLARPGVYPVSINLRTVDQQLLGRIVTFLTRTPDPVPDEEPTQSPLGVVLIAQITEPANPSSRELDAQDWLGIIGAHPLLAGSTALAPALIDTLATSSEFQLFSNATLWELTRQPYHPIDPAGLVAAGLVDELGELYADGLSALRTIREPTNPSLWLTGNLDPNQLVTQESLGIRNIVMTASSVSVTPAIRPGASVELIYDGIRFRALLTDDDLMVHTQRSDPALGAHHLLAHLATLALTSEPRNEQGPETIVTLDLTAHIDDIVFAEQFLNGLVDLTLISTLTATEGFGTDNATTPITGRSFIATVDDQPRTPLDYAGYRTAANLLDAFGSMVSAEHRGEADQLANGLLASLASNIDDLTRQNIWNRSSSYVRRETTLLDPPPLDSINLTSREALVPFSFQNRAEYPMRVEVRIVSDKLSVVDFDDGESTTLVLAPGITTREFRLRAQTSGSFPMTIELYSPDGQLALGESRAVVRSTAPTGIGLAMIIGAAAVLLGWWILDSMRRRRVRQ